jgi:hypothetical protein
MSILSGAILFIVIILIFVTIDLLLFAQKRSRLIRENSESGQAEKEEKKKVFVPNLKIWAFGAVAGLAIFLIPLIYKVMDIIFNTGWHRPFPRFYHRFTAWPHYLTQIFGLLFILGVIGIFAYTLVKISKDD